jgi:ABC-type polysaccharide/polyol phosphate export permease
LNAPLQKDPVVRPNKAAIAVGDAVRDLGEGVRHWPQWFTLGNLEIKLRFRRTALGPLWTTFSFALLAGVLSLVYARILHTDVRVYAPHLALGLLVWMFIAVVLQEACDLFVHAAPVLKQLYVPKSVLLYRLLWRNSLLFGLNAAVAAAILALCRTPVSPLALLAIPGFALICANLFWVSALLSLLGARFWGVSRATQAALPLAMLVTPVIWIPERPELLAIARWNPLYFALELVRGPLLGSSPAAMVWIGAGAAAILGGAAAVLAFAAFRRQLAYWL